ncbi:MAG: hydrogenase maturation protease [Ferruginibacter sp.]
MEDKRNILLYGIGNTLRGDDGAGIYVAGEIAKLQLKNLVVETHQQLMLEVIENFLQHAAVLVVDASVTATEVEIKKVTGAPVSAPASSHHTSLYLMNAMAAQLYGKKINLYTCAIPAANFELGEHLSAATKKHITIAAEKICKWVRVLNRKNGIL